MVRSRSRRDVPEVIKPARQATQWEIQSNAVLVELERKKGQHYEKWGVDRLITLVDIEFRTKFWVQMGRVWDALDMGDIDNINNGNIWTLEEIEVFLQEPQVQTIIKAKALSPTARMTKFTPKEGFGQGSGFDDMEEDLDAIFSGEPYEAKYKPLNRG